MMEQQDGVVNEKEDIGALLGSLGQAPSGVQLAEWNPLESIPTMAIGEEIKPGQVINAYFVRNESIASSKFKHSKTKNAEGVPTQVRHVFRAVAQNGGVGEQLFAIWTTGELKLVCDKLRGEGPNGEPGEFIQLTYREKGVNSKGQAQHFLEYKKLQPTKVS